MTPGRAKTIYGTAEAVPFLKTEFSRRLFSPLFFSSFTAQLKSCPDERPSSHADAEPILAWKPINL
jgi:hypothetical protein